MAVPRNRLLAVGAVPVFAAAVLGAEVVIAFQSPQLPETAPYDLSRPAIAPGATKVVWIGDSTAAGVGASIANNALPIQVARRSGNVDVTVLAVSGDRAVDVLRDQVPRVHEIDPDVVYISVGANDTVHATPGESFRRDYEHILLNIPSHSRVVALGVPDMGSPTRIPQPLRALAGARGKVIDDLIHDAATKHHAQYVDIAGATGEHFRQDPKRYFAADRFHPSDDGYRLWAEAVIDALKGG